MSTRYNRGNGFSLTSNLGTLQLWIGNNVPDNTSNPIYVFDSQILSNFVAIYYSTDQFTLLNSSTGSFSISPSLSYQKSEIYSWFYYVFRIAETQYSNCHDTNFVHFASPFEKTFILNAAANISSNCLSSILIPYVNPSCDQPPPLPIMYISSINYVGLSSVKVLSTVYKENYDLFEFSEENSIYWNCQNQSKIYQNGIFTNETIVFNTVEVNLDYSLGMNGQTSTGY